jgi:hypothetical protein
MRGFLLFLRIFFGKETGLRRKETGRCPEPRSGWGLGKETGRCPEPRSGRGLLLMRGSGWQPRSIGGERGTCFIRLFLR